jgi:4-hydroxy-tetrahydrodipicolinate synthase
VSQRRRPASLGENESRVEIMTIKASDLSGRLIPAVPVPFGRGGDVHQPGLEQYAAWMANQRIGGVAVWAHTGRGLRLTDATREHVLRVWRRSLGADRCLIAAAGAPAGELSVSLVMSAARAMAQRAADLGADALLVHPPVAFRERPDCDALILDYHSRIAEAGLPLVLFYLYEAAGGISYRPTILIELLARSEVLGIKVATLDSIMTFQDIARLVKSHAPEKLLITGEDRFLGYSVMCGAQAALIGMAAACTDLQAELLETHRQGSAERFLALSAAIDDLAQNTFVAPMEGYIQRMLWCLVHEGVIPAEAAHDPWGPKLDFGAFERIGVLLRRLRNC